MIYKLLRVVPKISTEEINETVNSSSSADLRPVMSEDDAIKAAIKEVNDTITDDEVVVGVESVREDVEKNLYVVILNILR